MVLSSSKSSVEDLTYALQWFKSENYLKYSLYTLGNSIRWHVTNMVQSLVVVLNTIKLLTQNEGTKLSPTWAGFKPQFFRFRYRLPYWIGRQKVSVSRNNWIDLWIQFTCQQIEFFIEVEFDSFNVSTTWKFPPTFSVSWGLLFIPLFALILDTLD